MSELDFGALRQLRERLAGLKKKHRPALEAYKSKDGKGFAHLITSLGKASMASTATCVTSLVATGQWTGTFAEMTLEVARKLTDERTSAGLEKDNPFSLSFMAEGIYALHEAQPDEVGLTPFLDLVRGDFAGHLIKHLEFEGVGDSVAVRGAISIAPYPPSAYLTQLVHRVLKKFGQDEVPVIADMHRWARNEINKQIALIGAKSRSSDPLQLAYALILALNTLPEQASTPEDKEIFSHALDLFFERQLEDGSWPLSRPMFHYSKVGSAYCFDFELLVQLLSCRPLRDDLLRHLPELQKALSLALHTSFDLSPETAGHKLAWASGHHPQLPGPESWSTASVYHFAHEFDRLVAEGVRRSLFNEIGETYRGPPIGPSEEARTGELTFGADFLDADLMFEGNKVSFVETLADRFVKPIARTAARVGHGGNLGKDTPMSAILFGPPGTSKTQLAGMIGDYLGWPLLIVDPSYLVQKGLDQIQAMANKLFSMLATAEEIVVLLDEFDEMGRNRSGNENLLSRFITTAMLPKLIAINDAKKIVFLLATNYASGFDAAFSREGRFDMRLQVMQPNARSKMNNPPWKPTFTNAFALLSPAQRKVAKRQLADLTYLETKTLFGALAELTTAEGVIAAFKAAHDFGTLQKTNDDGTTMGDAERYGSQSSASEGTDGSAPINVKPTWKSTSTTDQALIRLPPLQAPKRPSATSAPKPKRAAKPKVVKTT